MQALLAAMGEHPCIFVVGKGGVGKTTTAGAIALAAAEAGQSTHLVTTDPAESLSDLFQTHLPQGTPVPSPCTDGLTLEVFDARAWGDAWLAPRRAALAEVIEVVCVGFGHDLAQLERVESYRGFIFGTLNPDMPPEGMARAEYVEAKFGGPERARASAARPRTGGGTALCGGGCRGDAC